MAIVRTTKALAKRIDLHYFKRHHPLRSLKSGLSWGAAILAVLWVCGTTRRSSVVFMNGPVSTRHQLFGVSCEKCHEPWGALQTLTRGDEHPSVSDRSCSACHEGPPHHWQTPPEGARPGSKLSGDPACIHCHQEHRGHTALAALADRTCLECHRSLDKNTPSGYKLQNVRTEGKQVDSFLSGHPEFARIASRSGDTARVSLNHSVHLRKGLAGLPQGRAQLACEDCHQPDGARAYMRPVDYETHCAACHPINLNDDRFPAKMLPLPHDEPAVVSRFLQTSFAALVASNPEQITVEKKVRRKTEQIPILGDKELKADAFVQEQRKWLEAQRDAAEKAVLGPKSQTCQLCHVVTQPVEAAASEQKDEAASGEGKEAAAAEEHQKKAPGLAKVEPTAIPARWFVHSRFAHEPHRMLQCVACHTEVDASEKTSDVLLPGVETCRECHRPEPNHARADCVECHVFHDKLTSTHLNGRNTVSEVLKEYFGPASSGAK
ncbi:MAG: cytochrome c3 family protein [Planctomycetes bacterium]|nr:cytochrome c3 family protein [Planctomycetota bacterium]